MPAPPPPTPSLPALHLAHRDGRSVTHGLAPGPVGFALRFAVAVALGCTAGGGAAGADAAPLVDAPPTEGHPDAASDLRDGDAGGLRDGGAAPGDAHAAPAPDAGTPVEPASAYPESPERVLATGRWTDLPSWRDGALDVELDREQMVRVEDGATEPIAPALRRCRGVDGDGWRYCLEPRGEGQALLRVDGEREEELLVLAPGDAPGFANDWAVRADGVVYFTNRCDEHPRCSAAPEGTPGGVYRYRDGALEEVHAGIPNPNGIALSADGRTLYVAAAAYQDRSQARVHRFAVDAAGELGAPEAHFDVRTPDGMAVAPDGALWVAANDSSVVVHAPDGARLGRLRARGRITNLTFGGPTGRTAYLTTDSKGVFAFAPLEGDAR